MNLENLQRTVASWFEPGQLQHVLRPDSQAAQLATEWLARSGKRWRPFLSACAYQSLQELDGPLPEDFHKVALAVECFHKASLIHDDIEDHDEFRYGQKTLHEQYGVPIALNVGDMLLGQGYLMIAACQAPPAAKAEMLATASRGHCELCAGQGAELAWAASPGLLSVAQVTQIFRQKTAPAFDVALNLGAIYAGADGEVATILSRYSTALGIAYQIHDDLEDFTEGGTDIAAARPSMLLAIGCEQGDAATRERIASAWAGKARDADSAARHLRQRLVDLGVPAAAEAMLEHHKNLAISALAELENTRLKALLRRVVGRIFVGSGEEVMGCCDEYQAGNA